VSGWSLAKVVLVLSGVALLLFADQRGVPVLGWAGFGLMVVAFLLRFWQRAKDKRRNGSAPPG